VKPKGLYRSWLPGPHGSGALHSTYRQADTGDSLEGQRLTILVSPGSSSRRRDRPDVGDLHFFLSTRATPALRTTPCTCLVYAGHLRTPGWIAGRRITGRLGIGLGPRV